MVGQLDFPSGGPKRSSPAAAGCGNVSLLFPVQAYHCLRSSKKSSGTLDSRIDLHVALVGLQESVMFGRCRL